MSRCFDKEHVTTWYDDNHVFMMFLQQCNARLVRWLAANYRGMAVPVLLEFELDDRNDRAGGTTARSTSHRRGRWTSVCNLIICM